MTTDTDTAAPPTAAPPVDTAHLTAWLGRELPDPREVLTPKQLEVLALLARGRHGKEIADAMGLSPRTVERHTDEIYRRLGGGRPGVGRVEASLLGFVYGVGNEGRAAP